MIGETPESNVLAYDDVWRETGEYQIDVELTDIELEGVSQVTETVAIEDTDEEMVAVAVGSGEADEPIAIRVGESLSEFGQTTESGYSSHQKSLLTVCSDGAFRAENRPADARGP